MLVPLETIYGDGAAEQVARYEMALAAFHAIYGPGEVYIFRAPGRVNLIGEHTDYNHGYVLPAALDKDVLLLARPRPDRLVRLRNVEPDYPPVAFEATAGIPAEPVGSWGNYARGAAQRLAQHFGRDLTGFDGLAAGAPPFGVPRGAGLSSSSAFTVVVAVALAHLMCGADVARSGDRPQQWASGDRPQQSDAECENSSFIPSLLSGQALHPSSFTLARLCSEAEWYVGTRGGVMDQFIALLGQRDHALFLDCRPDAEGRYRTEPVALPQGYHLLVVNSGVRHHNTGGGYNRRVAECRAGVALLRLRYSIPSCSGYGAITHLRDVENVAWADLEPFLPKATTAAELAGRGIALGDIPGLTADAPLKVRARCRHVWTENHRVLAAMDALRAGDVARLGRLLDEAHASARDDYEISCPELECLVAVARQVDGVAGARLTGAGWGGCIVALVRADAVPAFEAHVAEKYHAETGLDAAIFDCRAGPGAGLVTHVSRA